MAVNRLNDFFPPQGQKESNLATHEPFERITANVA